MPPSEPPPSSHWPNCLPPRACLTSTEQDRFQMFVKRLRQGNPPPINALPPQWMRAATLRDPRQWDDVRVPLEGKRAPTGATASVTRWPWDRLLKKFPDLRLLAHGNNLGNWYAFPSSPVLGARLRALGRTQNSVTLADMLIGAAGLAHWHSRARWLNNNRFDCTIFNLALSHRPKTPDGEEAKRSRLWIQLGLAEPDADI